MNVVGIEELEHSFVLKNFDFEIDVSENGFIRNINVVNSVDSIVCNPSFILSISNGLSEPFVSQLSSLVSFEFDADFGKVKRIFTIKEKAFVMDDIFVATKGSQVDYELDFCFRGFNYFMVGRNRFSIDEAVNVDANDFLLVSEKQDIYLGCIFKEHMELNFVKEKEELNFKLLKKINLDRIDMFMLSYTFSLV